MTRRMLLIGSLIVLPALGIYAQTYTITNPVAPATIDDDVTINDPLIVSGTYMNPQGAEPVLKLWRDLNPQNGDWVSETHQWSDQVELEENPMTPGSGTWTAELWNDKTNPNVDPWTPSPMVAPGMYVSDHRLELGNFDNEQYYKVQ